MSSELLGQASAHFPVSMHIVSDQSSGRQRAESLETTDASFQAAVCTSEQCSHGSGATSTVATSRSSSVHHEWSADHQRGTDQQFPAAAARTVSIATMRSSQRCDRESCSVDVSYTIATSKSNTAHQEGGADHQVPGGAPLPAPPVSDTTSQKRDTVSISGDVSYTIASSTRASACSEAPPDPEAARQHPITSQQPSSGTSSTVSLERHHDVPLPATISMEHTHTTSFNDAGSHGSEGVQQLQMPQRASSPDHTRPAVSMANIKLSSIGAPRLTAMLPQQPSSRTLV